MESSLQRTIIKARGIALEFCEAMRANIEVALTLPTGVRH
jgi:hypothetical protein